MQLILADEDMAIDVGSIMVSGALRAGGPDCRLASRITVTFHPQPGVDVYNMVSIAGVICDACIVRPQCSPALCWRIAV